MGLFYLYPMVDVHFPEALRAAGFVLRVFLVSQDLRATSELQGGAILEVDKHKARMRVRNKVAQGIEHAITRVVGDA